MSRHRRRQFRWIGTTDKIQPATTTFPTALTSYTRVRSRFCDRISATPRSLVSQYYAEPLFAMLYQTFNKTSLFRKWEILFCTFFKLKEIEQKFKAITNKGIKCWNFKINVGTREYTYIRHLMYKCFNKMEKCQEILVYTFWLDTTVLFDKTSFFFSRT